MTRSELAKFDGRNGQPAYVAVGGIIYDLSESPLWKEGNHEGAHQAGCDLTRELKTAPHIAAVVERFPSVGRLEEDPPESTSGGPKIVIIAVLVAAMILTWFLLR